MSFEIITIIEECGLRFDVDCQIKNIIIIVYYYLPLADSLSCSCLNPRNYIMESDCSNIIDSLDLPPTCLC